MQIVGLSCVKCGERMSMLPDGYGCPDCNKAFHNSCMDKAGICPSCGRDLKSDREADDRFERDLAPTIERRYERLKKWTIGLSLAFVYFLLRKDLPGTRIPHWVMPVVVLVTLVSIHVTESRCPHCRKLVSLLGLPSRCGWCKGVSPERQQCNRAYR